MVGARLTVSTALVASTVSGFLIPPTSLSATEQGGEGFTLNIGSDHPPQIEKEALTSRIVRLPCYECAPNKDGDAELVRHANCDFLNRLLIVTQLFNFSLSMPDRKTLYFNNEVLYPDPETHDLTAAVVSVDEPLTDFEEDEHVSIPIELRGPAMVREMEVQGSAGMSLLQMSYNVVALRHGRNLHSSKIQLTIFRDGQDQLTIIRAAAFNVDEDGIAVPVSGPETLVDKPVVDPNRWVKPGCNDILCGATDRLNAKFEELKIAMAKSKADLKHAIDEVKLGHPPVLDAIEQGKEPLLETIEHGKHHLFKKPCNKHDQAQPVQISDEGHFPSHHGFGLKGGDESNLAPPPSEEFQVDEEDAPPMVHRPGHGKAHHDKQHFFEHHRAHRFRAHAAAVVLHIFVPIVFGVLIGLATYAVGVFVGCGIVWLWVKVFRRGKNNAQYEELPNYDSDDEERYLDSPKTPSEAPPAYAERWSQDDEAEKETQTDERQN
jgi:hypothetical protein